MNSDHYKWAIEAINLNKNIIIDKPITTSLKKTKKIIDLASKKKLFVSEAIVFHENKRFKNLIKKIDFKKKILIRSYFHIPKLDKNNFRNFKKYGGGCFQDMSPYAAYLIYIFFKSENYKIKLKNKRNSNFYGFSFLASNKSIKLNCSFKFNSTYKNEILIHNNSKKFYINFAFSPSIDHNTFIKIFDQNKKKEYMLKFDKENIFESYFLKIFKLIKNQKYDFYYKEINQNAEIRKKIS